MASPESMDARIFRAERRLGKDVIVPSARDWDAFLREFKSKYTLAKRTINQVIYDPIEVDGRMLLGIHKPLKTEFMTSIDADMQDVRDLMGSSDGKPLHFAHSSLVMFSSIAHIFAIVQGTGKQSPSHTAVKDFFDRFAKAPGREVWRVEPYLAPDQLDEFEKAKGLVKFNSRFSTGSHFFEDNMGNGGPVTFGNRFANEVGAELEIEISVRLVNGQRSQKAESNLYRTVKRELTELTRKNSRAKASVILPNNVEEEIHLVQHNLSYPMPLQLSDDEQRSYTLLASSLNAIRSDIDSKLNEDRGASTST